MENNELKILFRDRRWDLFYNDESIEEFVNRLPNIYLHNAVQQDVKESFRVVYKLLVLSYYEFSLVDVAVTNALHTFEMALKIQYEELNSKKWNGYLVNLIDWFLDRNFFERTDKKFFDKVRKMRNDLSHPERHNYLGKTWFPYINTVIDLVNDIYEEMQLREQRRHLADGIKNDLEFFLQKGAKVYFDGGKMLIYDHSDVLVNNYVAPINVYFCLLPAFHETTWKYFFPFTSDLAGLDLKSKTITFQDEKGNEVILTNELDDGEISIIEAFRKQVSVDAEIKNGHTNLLHDSQKFLLDVKRNVRYTNNNNYCPIVKNEFEGDLSIEILVRNSISRENRNMK